nr:unnamed protein product [Callosobruchus chinensis]
MKKNISDVPGKSRRRVRPAGDSQQRQQEYEESRAKGKAGKRGNAAEYQLLEVIVLSAYRYTSNSSSTAAARWYYRDGTAAATLPSIAATLSSVTVNVILDGSTSKTSSLRSGTTTTDAAGTTTRFTPAVPRFIRYGVRTHDLC